MANQGMKLRRFNEAEKAILHGFVDGRRAEGKVISMGDCPELATALASANKGIARKHNAIWDGLKRFGGLVNSDRIDRAGNAPKRAARKIVKSETAAKKVLDELAPIIKFMGKPPEYLKPLESLLIDYRVLANRLLAAEEKHSSVRAAVASAKSSAKKMKEMEKELKILRNFLNPAKILLKETASLRMQAAALTERSEAIKRKNGTDLISFLRALDESELLDE